MRFVAGASYAGILVTALLSAQQPPPSIVAEGVPEIRPEVVRKLARYQNVRTASFASWHPTRREMLIATRFGETPQIHYLRNPGGARTQVTFFPEPVPTGRFSPTGKEWFVFPMGEGGAEFFQLYRFDMATGEHHLLTDGKSRNLMGPFSNRGDRLAYTSTRRNGRDTDIYTMNPGDPSSAKMVYEAAGNWSPQDWSPDDTKLLIVKVVSINETYPHILDIATGRVEPLLAPSKEKVSYSGAKFSRDVKSIYLTTDLDSEFLRLSSLDVSSKKITPLTSHIPWDVVDFDLADDGSALAFVTNEDGIGKLHLLDTATKKPLPIPKLPVGQVLGVRFHKSLPEIAFGMVGAKVPTDVYSLNYKTGQVTRWTSSETGGLNPSNFPETELVHYPTFDSVEGKRRMIPAFVTKPVAKFNGPYPVLIEIHGGPEGQSQPGLNASYLVNEVGIAVIRPNVRGSSGYGKTYLKLDNAEKRLDSVKDIGALLDWIAKQPDLDAKRVAVAGGSYGGYMTLASVVEYSDRLRCGIDVVGISNWVTFLKNTQAYRQDLRRAEYGDERDPKMRDLLETISPLNNVAKIKVPLLIVQGRNDPRVPLSESQQMLKKLRDQGNTVWYIEGKDEGHGFAKKVNRSYQQWAEIEFLEKFLK
jgi:dipeptidyl aminopeptidase/acylaminoacyl peptidase